MCTCRAGTERDLLAKKALAERILKLGAQCRKLESEQEQVPSLIMPSIIITLDAGPTPLADHRMQ